MRLGFHYHIPLHRTASGALLTPGYLGVFLDHLAAACDELVCFQHSALPAEVPAMDYEIRARNLIWIDLGPHVSVPRRLLTASRAAARVSEWRGHLDALLIRGPSPLLADLAEAAWPLPTALLLVGDYVQSARGLSQPPLKKRLIQQWAAWNQRRQLDVARRSLTLVNSRALYEELKGVLPVVHETRTTTLTRADFFRRADTCLGAPLRLLYTGRMTRDKGLPQMVEALAMLVGEGMDAVLDLVGPTEPGGAVLAELGRAAERLGVGERLTYHGSKPVGPELFGHYREADVYLTASVASEGFPRTLWEAMAHSVPVVATRVGSIPHFLEHGSTAWLVKPGSAESLAEGVRVLRENGWLRRRLIENGLLLARENTLERRTEELVERIRWWVRQEAAA